MRKLVGYIEQEQPRINAVLAEETGRLDPLVRPVAEHVLLAGGKRLRPLLMLLCARALGRSGPELYLLASSFEFLHSATLLHDDILDGAVLRRGLPAAHLLFDRTRTILAGDVLLALGNRLMARAGDARLTDCIAEAIMHTALGEIAEIAHIRDAGLTEEQYLSIVTGKTAYLIQAACVCGAMYAGAGPDVELAAGTFGLNLGIAFQLVDDALDYSSSTQQVGKPVGADLREGKLTLPMLYYLRGLGDDERAAISDTLARNALNEAEIERLVGDVRARGCDRAARELAGVYLRTAGQALTVFPPGMERSMLEEMLEYVQTREK